MKNILLVISLLTTQFIYGQYEKVSVKELRESGSTYLNKDIVVWCDKFETKVKSIMLNMDGEPTRSNDVKNTDITDGKPHFIQEELITIVDEYEEFNDCYLYGINKREFVDKYSYRDIAMFGKIVDLENGKIAFKITKVNKRLTLDNIYYDYPILTMIAFSILIIFLIIFIYWLLIRYGIIIPNE